MRSFLYEHLIFWSLLVEQNVQTKFLLFVEMTLLTCAFGKKIFITIEMDHQDGPSRWTIKDGPKHPYHAIFFAQLVSKKSGFRCDQTQWKEITITLIFSAIQRFQSRDNKNTDSVIFCNINHLWRWQFFVEHEFGSSRFKKVPFDLN